jgi:hypothetical protein
MSRRGVTVFWLLIAAAFFNPYFLIPAVVLLWLGTL